ncbi:MAG: hypothetical protein FWD83_10115 [Promicromonosporaceae bacterium]|nr:hypothetical protein [Promicromonosporaceae bacterium]
MGTEHWFIDEVKQRGFTFAVVALDAQDVGWCRTAMSKLPRKRPSALHFSHELSGTRSLALRTIAKMPLQATLIETPKKLLDLHARERAVRKVAQLAMDELPRRIVFELDESTVKHDKRWLSSELARYPEIDYQHLYRQADALLWIADGIAWADNRGGSVRKIIEHLIVRVIEA